MRPTTSAYSFPSLWSEAVFESLVCFPLCRRSVFFLLFFYTEYHLRNQKFESLVSYSNNSAVDQVGLCGPFNLVFRHLNAFWIDCKRADLGAGNKIFFKFLI